MRASASCRLIGRAGASIPPDISPAAAAMIVDARELGRAGAPPPPGPPPGPPLLLGPAPAAPNVIPATSARREISFICARDARAMSPSG